MNDGVEFTRNRNIRKFFIHQILHASPIGESNRPSESCKTTNQTRQQRLYLHEGIEFNRVWLQGIVVDKIESTSSGNKTVFEVVVDDGTGIIHVDLSDCWLNMPLTITSQVQKGSYVMVTGPLFSVQQEQERMIQAHQLMCFDSSDVNLESIWFLEVIEYWNSLPTSQVVIE